MALATSAAQTAGGAANLSGGKVKIGVLTDIAGPTAMANGKGSVRPRWQRRISEPASTSR